MEPEVFKSKWQITWALLAEILGKSEGMVKSYSFHGKSKQKPPESVLLDLKRCDKLLEMGKIEPGNKKAIYIFLT